MPLSEQELSQLACERYEVVIIGGNAVFIADRQLGHKLYFGTEKILSRSELRRYVAYLDNELKNLSIREFFEKHDLRG
jgi:hypothetical protein